MTATNLPTLPEVSREFLIRQAALNVIAHYLPGTTRLDGSARAARVFLSTVLIDYEDHWACREIRAKRRALLNQYQEAGAGGMK